MNNKNEATGKLLNILLFSGALALAMTSPYFFTNVLFKKCFKRECRTRREKKKLYNAFYYLKGRGLIEMQRKGKQIFISLSEEGKKYAGEYQINDLNIEKPRQWDKKWRVLIFDIPNKHGIKREALRGKLKELGFIQMQKSVWVHPYECEKEIDLLKDFFGLSEKNLQLILAEKVENDQGMRRTYKL